LDFGEGGFLLDLFFVSKGAELTFVIKMQASLAEIVSERLQALAYALESQQIAESRVFTDGFVPALLAAQLVDTITWWLEQGRPYTPGQIAIDWYRLMCSTLREVSVWE